MNTGNNQRTMIINGMPVPIEGEKNILDVIRKAGFEMPTLCYYSDLSTYGACRMCIVEDKKGTHAGRPQQRLYNMREACELSAAGTGCKIRSR